jgi:hypothetical protein
MSISRTPNRADRFVALRLLSVILWGLLSIGGLVALTRYENTPAAATTAQDRWPVDTTLKLDSRRPTLVMFAHPHCPCTRASLAELERLVAQCNGAFSAQVVFLKPAEKPKDWEKTDLWRTAEAIPGATVIADVEGTEARRFGVGTSGHTLVYDSLGNRLFSGGMTDARGHQGDNAGRDAVVALLKQGSTDRVETPVFGCPIITPPTP